MATLREGQAAGNERRREMGMDELELVGWAETTVIIRFWLLTAIACGLGVALFYGEWLSAIGA